VIPIGLDFHVISPPSNQTQYLDIGLQFGASEEDAGDDAVVRLHQTRCASTSPVACSGQTLTQALEPIHVRVSLTGWRVRGSATDLTVSARRAR